MQEKRLIIVSRLPEHEKNFPAETFEVETAHSHGADKRPAGSHHWGARQAERARELEGLSIKVVFRSGNR